LSVNPSIGNNNRPVSFWQTLNPQKLYEFIKGGLVGILSENASRRLKFLPS